MNLKDIGFYTLTNERALNSSEKTRLYRCELLLTDRCNFKCPYCRGLKTNKDITYSDGLNILNLWVNHFNLKNLRFSGGEPTLHKDIPDFVKFAKNGKVERIAISTNGSSDIEYYKKLISYGVDDFSISLDACCSSTFNKMSETRNLFDKVIKNIEKLSKLTYVTVGIVFNDENKNEISDTIQFVYNLGVSDIRIIPSAQYCNEISSLNVNVDIMDRFPILKYRLTGGANIRLKKKPVRGLTGDDTGQCKLVLDDMAVWNNYHYPCIIYLREGGNPIGKVSENMRFERLGWYKKHNSWEDDICRKNCLDVCIDFNNVAHKFYQFSSRILMDDI